MKPVASGGHATAQGLRNDDALALQQAATVTTDYSLINPYCFAPAIAPHLAARQVGASIDLSVLLSAHQQLQQRADVVVVEGAGGWRVPLEPAGYLSDFPEQLGIGVILVVRLRLGCLNHALLTAAAIESGPCRLIGWVGNSVDAEFPYRDENIATLAERLATPCLGIMPHAPYATVAELAEHFRLDTLLQA
ncbi:MAG: dethiobiotin synthase, partial [Steroidobacteraceae bacterium]